MIGCNYEIEQIKLMIVIIVNLFVIMTIGTIKIIVDFIIIVEQVEILVIIKSLLL